MSIIKLFKIKQIIKHKKIATFLTLLVLVLLCVILISKSNNQKETSPYSQQEMREGIVYFNKTEEYNKALILANEYISLYPEDQEGWVHRGYAYFGLGNCSEAISDLTHASMNGNEEGSKLLTSTLNSEMCK